MWISSLYFYSCSSFKLQTVLISELITSLKSSGMYNREIMLRIKNQHAEKYEISRNDIEIKK